MNYCFHKLVCLFCMNTVTAIKLLDFHIFNQGIDSLQIFIRQCTLQQTIFTNRCVCFHKQSFAFDFRKKVIVINSIIERKGVYRSVSARFYSVSLRVFPPQVFRPLSSLSKLSLPSSFAVVNVHRFTRMLFFYACPGVPPQRCFAHSPRREVIAKSYPIRTVIQL